MGYFFLDITDKRDTSWNQNNLLEDLQIAFFTDLDIWLQQNYVYIVWPSPSPVFLKLSHN